MVVLDQIVTWTDEGLIASVTIRPESPFYVVDRGVPAHVGIEFMAQACGALAGLEVRAQGLPVRAGYLLGTRSFVATPIWFEEGWHLTVMVTNVFRDAPMGIFDC